jgi:CRISPR-associated protein Csm2
MDTDLKKAIPLIIADEDKADLLTQHADRIGQKLVSYPKKEDRLSTSQIRALFGEVRQIEAQWRMGGHNEQKAFRRLVLLKPKMAYRSKKEKRPGVEELVEILTEAVNQVIQAPDAKQRYVRFRHFVDFFEAILAYHKAHGGN